MLVKEDMIDKGYKFVNNHKNDSDEKQQAQGWIKDLLEDVFQIHRREVNAGFELQVKRNKNNKYIDHLLPGVLLTEMKSKGKNLDTAQEQAMQYVFDLDDDRKPKFVMLSDFKKIRLINLDNQAMIQFETEDLIKHLELFNFLINKEIKVTEPQSPVNKEAAIKLEKLHLKLLKMNYPKNFTTLLMTRLVFCFFAENTQIFEADEFYKYLVNYTQKDGSDLLDKLHNLFDILNTPKEERYQTEPLSNFPYINGGLFELPIKTGLPLGADTRDILISLTRLDWSQISPIIFGSMFEGAMEASKRHDLGAHFTSEKNILKVIDSLFLDDLTFEFEEINNAKRDKIKKLREFHDKLAGLNFLDPACGSGNFLIVAYREIRRLEHDVIQQIRIEEFGGAESLLSVDNEIKVEVSQYYGIEIQPYAVSIARLGMWLMDHLMNLEASNKFGQLFVRLPLHTGANIIIGNALNLDWEEVIFPSNLNFILGNPPFLGAKEMSKDQKDQLVASAQGNKSIRLLDFVSGWYIKSAFIMKKNPSIQAALVSTNSISQGQQAIGLWHFLFEHGIKINFGHRTFSWDNNGAVVHVVIVGFSRISKKYKYLYEYEKVGGEPHKKQVASINEYLLSAEPVYLSKQTTQISGMPRMEYGSNPIDDGNLILNEEEKKELVDEYGEDVMKYIRPFIGGRELIRNETRWILYLKGATSKELRAMPLIRERIEKIREFRLKSKRKATKDYANRPTEFLEDRVPNKDVLAVPVVSSERREYLPIDYLKYPTIPNIKIYQVHTDELFVLAVLFTKMHMIWLKTVGGRLKNDVSYSNRLVYNTLVFPSVNNKEKAHIESLAAKILSIRQKHFDKGDSLADLYDTIYMPYDLRKAHSELDNSIEIAYSGNPFKTDDERAEFLIRLYHKKMKKIKKRKPN